MTRCGCSRGGSGGVLVAGPGLEIDGDGTPQLPRTIRVVDDPHVCSLAAGCLSTSLCRGLSYDGECVGLDLSAEEGNVLSLDPTDGGLYGECPTALSCGVTVENLPSYICGASAGAGWNNGPSVLASYERAISLGVVMSALPAQRLADGSWVSAPPGSLADSTNDPSSDREYWEITAAQSRSIKYEHDPAWEWLRPQRSFDSLTSVLDVARGRHVVAVRAPLEVSDPNTGTVQEMVNQVAAACAQANVIVTAEAPEATAADRQRLSVARAAGLETGVSIRTDADLAVHPAATLAAEGVRWVFVHRSCADATFNAYTAAGLQVLMQRAKLRTDSTRAQTLGLRGVMSDDPAYTCALSCRRTADPWTWPNWANGQLGTAQIVRDTWRTELGMTTLKTGWGGTATAGWRFPDEDPGKLTGVALLGWAVPLPSTTTYTINWEQWWGSLDGGRRNSNTFGMIFGCPDDTLPISDDQTLGPTVGNGRTSGYVALHQVGDPSNPTTTTMTLTKITKGAAAGTAVGATGTKSNLGSGAWVKFRINVSGSTIKYTRLTAANAVQYEATMTDSTHRGNYLWLVKLQGSGTAVSQRFATAYRNLTITTP